MTFQDKGYLKLLRENWTYIPLAILMAFVFFPFYWLVKSSFSTNLFAYPPSILPEISFLSPKYYMTVLAHSPYLLQFFNSLIAAVSSTGVAIAISCLGAYSLSRSKLKKKEHLAGIILFVYIFPPVTLTIPLYILFHRMGLLDTRICLFLAYTTKNIPFALWLMWSFFNSIPSEIDESGRIDGASRWQVLTKIVLPLSTPGIVTVAIFAFINAWNEFVLASVFIVSETKRTLPLGLHDNITGEFVEWGGLLSMATLTMLPVFVFFLIIQRGLVKGLTLGAVKG